jgi:hypothetical protein
MACIETYQNLPRGTEDHENNSYERFEQGTSQLQASSLIASDNLFSVMEKRCVS